MSAFFSTPSPAWSASVMRFSAKTSRFRHRPPRLRERSLRAPSIPLRRQIQHLSQPKNNRRLARGFVAFQLCSNERRYPMVEMGGAALSFVSTLAENRHFRYDSKHWRFHMPPLTNTCIAILARPYLIKETSPH